MNLSSFLHLIVIIPSMFLLQYHGVQFWMGAIGLDGALWSILLDIINFWCWFQLRESKLELFVIRTLGALTILLLLVGPLYSVSHKALNEINIYLHSGDVGEINSEELVRLEENISRKTAQAKVMLSKIQEKDDGYNTFNKIENEIMALEKKRDSLVANNTSSNPKLPFPLEQVLISIAQAIGVIVIKSVMILAILRMSWGRRKSFRKELEEEKEEQKLEELEEEQPEQKQPVSPIPVPPVSPVSSVPPVPPVPIPVPIPVPVTPIPTVAVVPKSDDWFAPNKKIPTSTKPDVDESDMVNVGVMTYKDLKSSLNKIEDES